MSKIRAYQYLQHPVMEGERGITGWVKVEEPVCPEFGAILRPVAVAACTSDVHGVRSSFVKVPSQLGHETVGEVLEIGKYVTAVKPGDRVIISNAQPRWGTPESYDYPAKLAKPDPSEAILAARTWVEKFAIDNADMNLVPVPESISNVKAVMIPDMMVTAFGAIESSQIRFGDDVAIIGTGPVGLMAVAGCAIRGAGNIYAVGSRRACKETAYKYGASKVIDYHGVDIFEEILKANGGKRVDAVIIAGGEDNDLLGQSLRCVKNGGHIVNVVGFMDLDKDFVIPAAHYMMGTCQTTICGSVVGGGRHYIERLIKLVENGRIDPSLAVSHVLHGFDAIPDALAIMENKTDDMIKSVVLMDE